jgi:hypothetical protein
MRVLRKLRNRKKKVKSVKSFGGHPVYQKVAVHIPCDTNLASLGPSPHLCDKIPPHPGFTRCFES